jgi:hypothetical protein
MDWQRAAQRHEETSVEGRLFQGLVKLINTRKRTTPFHAQAGAYPVWTHNEHVFGLIRTSPRGKVLVLGNFSDQPQTVPAYRLAEMGFGGELLDLVEERPCPGWRDLSLGPYGFVWLQAI